MSSVAEIEAAFERLSPSEVNQLAAWLEQRRQELLRSSARTVANGTAAKTRGGLPLLPSCGEVVTLQEVRPSPHVISSVRDMSPFPHAVRSGTCGAEIKLPKKRPAQDCCRAPRAELWSPPRD